MTMPASHKHSQWAADKLVALMQSMRANANALKSQCDAGSVNLQDIASGFLQQLIRDKTDAEAGWDALMTVPGVGLELQARYSGKVFVADVELAAVSTAIGSLIATLAARVPKDPSNRWLNTQEFDGNNKLIPRTVIDPTDIGSLRNALNTFLAAFDLS